MRHAVVTRTREKARTVQMMGQDVETYDETVVFSVPLTCYTGQRIIYLVQDKVEFAVVVDEETGVVR